MIEFSKGAMMLYLRTKQIYSSKHAISTKISINEIDLWLISDISSLFECVISGFLLLETFVSWHEAVVPLKIDQQRSDRTF